MVGRRSVVALPLLVARGACNDNNEKNSHDLRLHFLVLQYLSYIIVFSLCQL